MKALLKKYNIDETYTKPLKVVDDKVKENTYPKGGYNFMADLLQLPITHEKFKYMFVIVDLWSNAIDFEPIKNKTAAEVLNSLKKVLKRPYIKDIKASVRTDKGAEFQGVFHKWLYDEDILQRISEANRHKQMGNVENANKLIDRFLNGYMNGIEEKTGKGYKEWTDIIDDLRIDLNKFKLDKFELRPDSDPQYNLITKPIDANPKFKIGDLVYYNSEYPRNALGEKYSTNFGWREGDYRFDITDPRHIKKILYYPKNIRYMLSNKKHCSYSESELRLAKKI